MIVVGCRFRLAGSPVAVHATSWHLGVLHWSVHSLMAVRPLLSVPSEQRRSLARLPLAHVLLPCRPHQEGRLQAEAATLCSDAHFYSSHSLEVLCYMY